MARDCCEGVYIEQSKQQVFIMATGIAFDVLLGSSVEQGDVGHLEMKRREVR